MIPVELNAELVLPSGDRIRWDAAAPDPGKRPIAPSFDTETGRGFSTGSVTLTRPTDRDYPELGLLNELILRSATGQVVYQGRAQGIPVGESFSLDCDGWMSHGEQRQITELLVDREVSAWAEMSAEQQQRLAIAGFGPFTGPTGQGSFFQLQLDRLNQAGTTGPTAGATYTSPAPIGSVKIGRAYRDAINVNFRVRLYVHTNRAATSELSAVNADGITAGTTTLTTTADARYATVRWFLNTSATGDGKWAAEITPAVYGTSGIPFYDREDGLDGFHASDAIRYLAKRYCPKWNTSGIQQTTYPIPHAVWRDPTTPADAIRQLNSYHLWKLGVWEDRRLDFSPYDLSVADWQVAGGVDGVRVEYQGDTTENVYNGAAVTYNDFDGERYRLTPNDSEDLRDRSEWIAANQWGDEVWLNVDVSWPAAAEDAIEIGRLALANANLARRPSTITVPATIRDIHGNLWPSSYVRSDQTIVVTNQHTAIPRLITRTSWNDHTLTITTDNAIDTLEAFTTRLSGALSASGVL